MTEGYHHDKEEKKELDDRFKYSNHDLIQRIEMLKHFILNVNELTNKEVKIIYDSFLDVYSNYLDGRNLFLSKLSSWINYCGEFTTVGGSSTEDFEIQGVKVNHICFVQIKNVGSIPRTIIKSSCGDGKISVTFDDDPSDDHLIKYVVINFN